MSFSWFSGKELVNKQYEEVLDEGALFQASFYRGGCIDYLLICGIVERQYWLFELVFF